MKDMPINCEVVKKKILASRIPNIGRASIRQILKLVSEIEQETGEKFVRMEMGIPGLPPVQIGVDAEIEALRNGVASIYSNIEGFPELKREISRFVKLFLDVSVRPEGCLPTVGSCMGSFASFLTLDRLYPDRTTHLFIDPGFPVHKQQLRVLGQEFTSFDLSEYRGDRLGSKLESYFKKGDIISILYSNPNNPSWMCLTEKELKTIGELASKYNVVIIEDLAYFGMDFRKDYSTPGHPPYQPTVAHYTDKYIMLISTSKFLSYAGQKIGMLVISDTLYKTTEENLRKYFPSDMFGPALIFGSLYSISAGTAHSAHYALTAMLKALNEGRYNYRTALLEYGERARIMKQMFIENGFKIVYDMEEDEPIADGFYFTFSYPGFTGEQLVEKLLYYGISAISLTITGSNHPEGLRACVSQVSRSQLPILESRLKRFREDHTMSSGKEAAL